MKTVSNKTHKLLIASVIALSLSPWVGALAWVGGTVEPPELVEVAAGVHEHRASGEFLKNGYPVDAPKIQVRFSRSLFIMKYQVTNKEYARCLLDKTCGQPFMQNNLAEDDKPVTGVSFIDAQTYANWLTKKTGIVWRLPSDAEWSYSAGSRFFDDALKADEEVYDPSQRGLLKYQQAIDQERLADPAVKLKGTYGANENGIYDQAGNVWEWTQTCYRRSTISRDSQVSSTDSSNCGVRVVEGKHRSYMTFFVQDAKSGGCAVGTPPDHLGFRLVRDNPPFFSIKRFSNWWVFLSRG